MCVRAVSRVAIDAFDYNSAQLARRILENGRNEAIDSYGKWKSVEIFLII